MFHHRFREQREATLRPALAAPVMAASAFMACPLAPQQTGVEQLYRLAFEQAQAVLRPSRLERLQAMSLN